MKNAPMLSIGMPVYNGSASVRKALDSLLSQTFTNFELIISDNASTDDTETICKEYASKDSRIRYVRQPKNFGAAANFAYVLAESKGDFFMWAAADDFRVADCVETYLSIIGDAGGAFTTYSRIDYDNDKIINVAVPVLKCTQLSGESLKCFLKNNRPSFIYGLYRTSAIKDCFEGLYFDWADCYFVLSVINKYGINSINTPSKYFAGYRGSYAVKPGAGRYIRPFTYFIKALPFAITAGPIGLIHHLKVLVVSAMINVRIFMSELNLSGGNVKSRNSPTKGYMK